MKRSRRIVVWLVTAVLCSAAMLAGVVYAGTRSLGVFYGSDLSGEARTAELERLSWVFNVCLIGTLAGTILTLALVVAWFDARADERAATRKEPPGFDVIQ